MAEGLKEGILLKILTGRPKKLMIEIHVQNFPQGFFIKNVKMMVRGSHFWNY
jgi:hypothetical protein